MKRLLIVGLLLVAVGCSSSGGGQDCKTGMALPPGFPDSTDGMTGLIYSTCQYEQAEMTQLRNDMKKVAKRTTKCLHEVYGYTVDGVPVLGKEMPFAAVSKVNILPVSFKGRDGKMRDIQYLQAGYFVKFHPTKKADGSWKMGLWAGEMHTMYRVNMLGTWDHGKVYDKNLPFENAATIAHDTCIEKWKP